MNSMQHETTMTTRPNNMNLVEIIQFDKAGGKSHYYLEKQRAVKDKKKAPKPKKRY